MQLKDLVGLEPAALRCPATVYEGVREKGVHFDPAVNAYVVGRQDAVVEVLRDNKRFSSSIAVGNKPPSPEGDPKRLLPLLILSDGEEHARRRSIVNRAFTPSQVQAWEPVVREVCEDHLKVLRGLDEVDLVSKVARPLPIRIITRLLGVPQNDVDQFRDWSEQITNGVGGHSPDPERHEKMQQDFTAYIARLLDDQATRNGSGVIAFIATAEASGELSRKESISFVIELIVAGNITTTHHLASSMALLGRHDGLLDRLYADQSLIPRFIEESLRLESPIQGFYRLATEDSVVGGTRVPAGSRVLVLYASANRDAAVWDECPHIRFDRKNASSHLAFGRGTHACLGSSLARLEGRVVVETLISRIANIELLTPPDELEYHSSFINHGPKSLPARLTFRSSGATASAHLPGRPTTAAGSHDISATSAKEPRP